MKCELDHEFFRELNEMDPGDVCRRALCRYDRDNRSYILEAWGNLYAVYHESDEIKPVDGSLPQVNKNSALVILFYLLRAADILVKNEWISEKDIPGGVRFFTGPHSIPGHLIVEKFGNDLNGFRKACETLGGEKGDMADASYIFRITPRIPAAVLFWLGDSEFEPEVKILFDRTIDRHLPIDVIFALVVELCERIASHDHCCLYK